MGAWGGRRTGDGCISTMKILLASSSLHKRGEISAIWAQEAASAGIGAGHMKLVGLDSLGRAIDEPVEDQPTFEGNARLKAEYYAAASGMIALADDSGLEVDALGGEPGVLSARYSGQTGPRDQVDAANNALLLERLAKVPAERRTARFVCAMALVEPGVGGGAPRLLAEARGTVEGAIIGPGDLARGDNGFGYDPLFLLPDVGKTTAELPPDAKNAISHRGKASRAIWEKIQRLVNADTGSG